MQTANQTTLYNLGVSFGGLVVNGSRPQQSVVVFDWGEPDNCGTYYGADDWASGYPCVPTPTIKAAMEQFAAGFFNATTSDTSAYVSIVVGTSNYGTWFATGTNSSSHASAWGTMVNNLNAWLQSNPSGCTVCYSARTIGQGGIDAELDWNGPTPTKAWSDGYASTGKYAYWDYGDAAGCPYPSSPSGTWISGGCDNGWGQYGVWYKSWGNITAVPLPEVYNDTAALRWGNIADYSSSQQKSAMRFEGAVSEYQACADHGNPPQCNGADNTPTQSWTQLYAALNCSGCPLPQTPPYVTDIRWTLSA